MAAAIKIPAQFTAVDKFSNVVGKMATSTKKFATTGVSAVKRFDHRITKSFNKLGRLSQLAIGVGLGTLFINAIDDVKTFETNLVGVGKTTGITGSELKQLGQDTIAVSNSLRGIKTNKLLELGGVAGQLGITGSDNILKFSTTMAQLEKATDIQGADGASDIAKLLNITGEGPGIIDKFGSSLVALGNKYSTTESAILSVANEVGRSTAAYGLNSKEILGMSAALSSIGVAPEAAGSAIGKTFLGIEKATLKGGKELRNYAHVMGLTSQETKTLFASDKQAAFNKLLEGLNRIGKKGGSVTKAMSDLGIADTRVLKGIIPLASKYDAFIGTMATSASEFDKNIAVTNEFATATGTVQTGLDDISKRFTNVITQSTTAGSGLEFVRDMLFFVADNMDSVVVAGGILLGSFIALKTVTGIITGIELATKLWTGAQWLLNIAMDANPIGLIIIAIATLVGLVASAINNYDEWGAALLSFMGPLGFVINLIMSFKKHWDSIVEAFQTDGILGGLKRIGEVMMDALLYPMEQFLRLAEKIPGVGKFAKTGLALISNLREKHNLNTDGEFGSNEIEPVDSTQVSQAKSDAATREAMIRGGLDINVKDPGNVIESVTPFQDSNLPLITSTQGVN